MLSSVSSFVRRRQRGIAAVASAAGGVYLLARYARQRFADLSEQLVSDRAAKENLRRRFQQNQEDCAFTLMALLPELSRQILEELDVEALSTELQNRAEAVKKARSAQTAATESLNTSTADLNASTTLPNPSDSLQQQQAEISQDKLNNANADGPSRSQVAAEPCSTPPDPRSKAELWQELKLMTFHRTCTAMYLICILAMQTHIQLNLIGRHKYISSVYEQATSCASASSASASSLHSVLDGDAFSEKTQLNGHRLDGDLNAIAERQYLTFTWWLLQRGWKRVSQRVRKATENVVQGISLKTSLDTSELRKIIADIRREVEYEDDGSIYSFEAVILPSTAPEEAETLKNSGLVTFEDDSASVGPELRQLLDETLDFIESPDFAVVLRSCLNRTFARLAQSLAHLFADASIPSSTTRFSEVTESKVRLAAILPALGRATHSVLMEMPNEYADAIAQNRELQEFSAVVYSSFPLQSS